MLSRQLRNQFIGYFKKQGHTHVPSSAVVPHEDPTLLFTNAGMNQFKELFLGMGVRDYKRAVTSQKCIRAGGKHNDLENVGHTSRHLTFFEMLGNFSFGDYFKEESIRFAWELSTEFLGFAPERIWPSVFRDDDEAFELWTRYVPAERITRLGEKDNFWAMGDTGPCGPCSELYYDKGPLYGSAQSIIEDTNGERFFEFWNLVFMQYNRHPDGTLERLPKPCVDTGAGLERIVSLQMGVESVFETDVLRGIIAQVEERSNIAYHGASELLKPAFHVIADHLRCLAFAIADGAQPSNVERGYVLRKILRRAVRYGKMLGFEEPFLASILPKLVALMGDDYPELVLGQSRISEILTLEEEAFFRVLQRGGNMLQQVVQRAEVSEKRISGDDAFKLKDTYGLPIEEIALIAKDGDLTVDMERFQQLEEEAKERSRRQHKGAQQIAGENLYAGFAEEHPGLIFTGYTELVSEGIVLGLMRGETLVEVLKEGEEGIVLLDKTPFYAEMGGQVGDQGTLSSEAVLFSVENCLTPYKGVIAHIGRLQKGEIKVGDRVSASVDVARRHLIAAHHSATHILHWALHRVLGPHIRQAGSVVDDERLRFDFSHHKALSKEEIQLIEDMVNEKVRENVPVQTYELSYEEAQKRADIRQFFGDKYGSTVRVVDMGFSKELCGGTHVNRSGDLGYFAFVKEGSIAAGVRRIEAAVGPRAEALRRSESSVIDAAALLLKCSPSQLLERVAKLQEENKQLTLAIKKVRQGHLERITQQLSQNADSVEGLRLVIDALESNGEELRECADELMKRFETDIVILACRDVERCQVIIRTSDAAMAKGVRASDLAKEIGTLINGSGGGRANAAQAGGKDPAAIEGMLVRVRGEIAKVLVGV